MDRTAALALYLDEVRQLAPALGTDGHDDPVRKALWKTAQLALELRPDWLDGLTAIQIANVALTRAVSGPRELTDSELQAAIVAAMGEVRPGAPD